MTHMQKHLGFWMTNEMGDRALHQWALQRSDRLPNFYSTNILEHVLSAINDDLLASYESGLG